MLLEVLVKIYQYFFEQSVFFGWQGSWYDGGLFKDRFLLLKGQICWLVLWNELKW